MGGYRKNVLLLCEYQAIYGGNFVPSLVALEEALRKYGYGVVYVFPNGALERPWLQQLKGQGRTVETISFKVDNMAFVRSVSTLAERYDVGIVHTHFTSMARDLLFAVKHPAIQVFAHIHSDFSAGHVSLKMKLRNWLVYRLLAGRVRFFSVSKAFVQINPKKIRWVPNGLADRMFCTEHTAGSQLRRQWQIAEDELLCEVFGWTPMVKGVDIAVEAVAQLYKAGQKIKLAIICGREMTPDKMKKWVEENTSCTGEESFLLYWEPIEDVFAYHEAADVLLSASRSEGFSYAILEMLSIGKKCVISDIPGVAWAKEFPAVYPFKNKEADACADMIMRSQEAAKWDPEVVREQVRNQYSIQSWVRAILKGYGVEDQ